MGKIIMNKNTNVQEKDFFQHTLLDLDMKNKPVSQ